MVLAGPLSTMAGADFGIQPAHAQVVPMAAAQASSVSSKMHLEEGATITPPVEFVQNDLTWSIPDSVTAGDASTITIPNHFTGPRWNREPIKDANGNIGAYITGNGSSYTVEYTDFVDTMHNVTFLKRFVLYPVQENWDGEGALMPVTMTVDGQVANSGNVALKYYNGNPDVFGVGMGVRKVNASPEHDMMLSLNTSPTKAADVGQVVYFDAIIPAESEQWYRWNCDMAMSGDDVLTYTAFSFESTDPRGWDRTGNATPLYSGVGGDNSTNNDYQVKVVSCTDTTLTFSWVPTAAEQVMDFDTYAQTTDGTKGLLALTPKAIAEQFTGNYVMGGTQRNVSGNKPFRGVGPYDWGAQNVSGDAYPTLLPDVNTTEKNTPVVTNVLENDSSTAPGVSLDPATVEIQQADGTWAKELDNADGHYSVNPDGTIEFTPATDFVGPAAPINYRASDTNRGMGESTTLTVTVTEEAVPVPPVANPDEGTTDQGNPVTIPVLDNDTPGDTPIVPGTLVLIDPETGEPTDKVTTPEGTFEVVEDNVVFTPEPDYTGTTPPITYVVEDEDGDESSSTITVTVNEPAATPEATPDTATTPEGTPVTIDVISNDVPVDGVPFDKGTLVLVDADEEGKVVIDEGIFEVVDGKIVFTPADDFFGEVPPVTYEVTDNNGDTATSTVTVTVTESEDVVVATPEAAPDTATTPEGSPVTIDVLGNDKPVDGAPFDKSTLVLVDADKDGKVVLEEGTFTVVDGKIVFTPADDFFGEVPPVSYEVTDSNGDTVTSTVTVTVTEGEDDPLIVTPEATPDTAKTPEGTPVTIDVLGNDKPVDGIPFNTSTLVLVDADEDGKVVLEEGTFTVVDGKVVFTPAKDFVGKVPPVAYEVTDSNGTTVTSTVTVTVIEVGDIPVDNPTIPGSANDDSVTTPEGEPVTIDVLENDKPTEGAEWDDSTLVLIDGEGNPTDKIVVDEGTFKVVDGKIVFTPADGFSGKVPSVKYEVTDTEGNKFGAEVNVTVEGSDPVDEPKPDVTTGGDPTQDASGGILAGVASLFAGLGLLFHRKRGEATE